MANQIKEKVNGEQGYYLGLKLSEEELSTLREMVSQQWIARIARIDEDLAKTASSIGIENYHQIADRIEHSKSWPKVERILPEADTKKIRNMNFFKKLEDNFGEVLISDEENVGFEEMYWRLVRPKAENDVGPVHADKWFWDLGHGEMPKNHHRVKVWIPLVTEVGKNGLLMKKGSHLKTWKYHGEKRHGFEKPVIDENIDELNMELLDLGPGEAVVFNDRCLHGGAVNQGEKTRLSLEFTMFVKDKFRKDSLSIVVPSYNEEKNIEATIFEIEKAREELPGEYEIIVVDDCSSDSTYEIVEKYANDNPRIKLLQTNENLGFGGAYKLGLQNASMDYVIMVCGDDCIGAESLKEIFSYTGKKDLVIPYTGNPETRPMIRRFLSWAFVKILNITFQNSVRYYNGHNILPTKEAKEIDFPDDFSYAAVILVDLLDRGFTYSECPMIIRVRQVGTTKAFRISNVFKVLYSVGSLVFKTYARRSKKLLIFKRA